MPDAAIAQAKILLGGDTKDRVIASMEKCRNAADGTHVFCTLNSNRFCVTFQHT
jgi:hypothetical protein